MMRTSPPMHQSSADGRQTCNQFLEFIWWTRQTLPCADSTVLGGGWARQVFHHFKCHRCTYLSSMYTVSQSDSVSAHQFDCLLLRAFDMSLYVRAHVWILSVHFIQPFDDSCRLFLRYEWFELGTRKSLRCESIRHQPLWGRQNENGSLWDECGGENRLK